MAVKVARPLRFRIAWENYCVGDMIGLQADNPVSGTLREFLLENGFCEAIELPADLSPIKPAKNKGIRIRQMYDYSIHSSSMGRDNHFSLKLVTAPTVEPLLFEEAVAHLQNVAEDQVPLVEGLILAARQHVESYCQRRLINSTWDYKLDRFPYYQVYRRDIHFPYAPLSSVTSITYVDQDGNTQTWATSNYVVDSDSEPGRVALAYNAIWPYTQYLRPGSVTIRYVAGYGATEEAVPEAIKAAIKLLISHWYENREPVTTDRYATPIPITVDALLSPYRLFSF